MRRRFPPTFAAILLGCLLFVPFRGRCGESQSNKSDKVTPKPPRIKKFKVTLRRKQLICCMVGPNSEEWSFIEPVSSKQVEELLHGACVELFQPLGFSINQPHVNNPLEPLPDNWGTEYGVCWTDIQELDPLKVFGASLKTLKLPQAATLHYGFQIATRWSVDTSGPVLVSRKPSFGPPVLVGLGPPWGGKTAWTKVRGKLVVVIHERRKIDLWVNDLKDYNSRPLLDWLENHLVSELDRLANPMR
jgi:hypothetical protein